jgi:segregation and condensation protein B
LTSTKVKEEEVSMSPEHQDHDGQPAIDESSAAVSTESVPDEAVDEGAAVVSEEPVVSDEDVVMAAANEVIAAVNEGDDASGDSADTSTIEEGAEDLHVPIDAVFDPANVSLEVTRAIEAILMVADVPVTPQLLGELLEIAPRKIESICAHMAASYEEEARGFVLARVAGGYRYQSHPDLSGYVERFVLDGQAARLSQAAMETLAIVAYKQPISRAQVAAIRGVNVDGVMRTLVQRNYVAEVAIDPGPGQAALFGTTPLFLQNLGLDTLKDLPALGDLVPGAEVMEALEASLRIDDQSGRPVRSNSRNSGDPATGVIDHDDEGGIAPLVADETNRDGDGMVSDSELLDEDDAADAIEPIEEVTQAADGEQAVVRESLIGRHPEANDDESAPTAEAE